MAHAYNASNASCSDRFLRRLGTCGSIRRRNSSNATSAVADLLADRDGLEIGGPTDLFRRRDLLPAYALARSIDNANFERRTVWNDASGDFTYDARHTPGRQHIVEATALTSIADAA